MQRMLGVENAQIIEHVKNIPGVARGNDRAQLEKSLVLVFELRHQAVALFVHAVLDR